MTNKIVDFYSMVKQTGVWDSANNRFTLGAASSGFRAMKDVHTNNDKVGYYVDNGSGSWMYVVGSYSTSANSPNYLVYCNTADVVESNNSNARISLTNGVSYNIHEGPSPLQNKFYGVTALVEGAVIGDTYTSIDFSTPAIDTNNTWNGTSKYFSIPTWCSQVEVDVTVKWISDLSNSTQRGIYLSWTDDFETPVEWHWDIRSLSDLQMSLGMQKLRAKFNKNVKYPSTGYSYDYVKVRLAHDYSSNTMTADVYLMIRWIP